MASIVQIANLALTSLSADRITSLEDNSENARRLTAIYYPCLEDVLRTHPWNFAIQRQQLALLSTTPTYGYDYEFQIPGDSLRIIEVYDGSSIVTNYKVEGRKILANVDSIYIKYVGNITDPNQYTSQFIYLLASRLASELAYPITNNKENAKLALEVYLERLRIAKSADAQESDSVNTIDEDLWTIENRQ